MSEANWADQEVHVQGRAFKLGDVLGGKLFHGSPAQLAPGDVLEPGRGRNFKESARDAVSLTSDPGRARYWAHQADDAEVHVYEVEPLGTVEVWRVGLANSGNNITLWEGRAPRARVVREHSPPWS